MAEFTMSAAIDAPYGEAVTRVREGLAAAGFGVLTEIDLKATLKAKLDVDVPPKVILGACRPQLAHEALGIDSRVAALLPCNVVVSADGTGALVEVMDPNVMPEFTGTAALSGVAADARERLAGMLDGLRA
ncbi:DUF302 domain-containing protein [Tsukamurella ocularis]|uniref:DUF302 domain-containing protein n=1 Tax=Tsukamurella ocularis TaxID=1970234 RepID=UPI0021692084|nr:DUF302 domain-containing protein [Tsukamurella ocularis]MCS3781143.1 uncharacterized protein (DUF302 family) [Tsukamurella ocularis]MCS3786967.1 uncharacterized protein (DUF302 family) [Tsukamurella ocularis]MCS3850809.1 uncharacterized protein (DUF302 family) [Tsukamurella ocularis]